MITCHGHSERYSVKAFTNATRFSKERVLSYIKYQAEFLAPVTVATYMGQICMVVVAMFPAEDWGWLRHIQRSLARRAKPQRQKSNELVSGGELVQLAFDLLADSKTALASESKNPEDVRAQLKAARNYRDGLLIGLLAHRPLRVSNLLGIEIGKQLLISNKGVDLRFTREETKTKRTIAYSWPEPLCEPLVYYIHVVRPILMVANARSRNAPATVLHAMLWVGQGGTIFSSKGLDKALRRHTLARFGKKITAQRFRDIAASTIANEDPQHVRNAALLLGHTGLRTTERHYITPNSRIAMSHYHQLVGSLRKSYHRTSRRETRGS